MKVIIMAGGRGTRFWPRSTEEKPKQFLKLTSESETMLQQTYSRFHRFVPKEDIYVVAGTEYLELIKEQLQDLDESRIIVEPGQRDTAACIALAARYFLRNGINDVMVTAPSDQYIDDPDLLADALREAEDVAQADGAVVTLGIIPTRAETGYGYIEVKQDTEAARKAGSPAKRVNAFIEKPTKERALELLEHPGMYWNSGIFIWKPSTIAYYMEIYQPEMWSIFDMEGIAFQHAYESLKKVSIDFALMEKIPAIYMIPIKFVWDDVGTWTSLERIFERNADGNLLSGSIAYADASNNIIMSEEKKTIVIGVKDLIIVSTDQGLLVCSKTDEQRIKQLLAAEAGKERKREQ